MQYSLLDRFRGTLLGGVLGERLGRFYCQQGRLPEPELTSRALIRHLGAAHLWSQDSSYFGPNGLVPVYMKQLMQLGEAPLQLSQTQAAASATFLAQEAAILALPLALFFHDNLPQLQRQWQQGVERSHPRLLALSDGVWVFTYTVAQSVRARLQPLTLIPEAIAYLQASAPETAAQGALLQQLSQVQTLLEERAALATVLTHLRTGEQLYTPLAIALYCFLSTPEDLDLAIVRAAQSGPWPILTCSLTGILVGAYGGTLAIPATWRRLLCSTGGAATLTGEMAREPELLGLADQFWATWGGTYDPFTLAQTTGERVAIAAPEILRLR